MTKEHSKNYTEVPIGESSDFRKHAENLGLTPEMLEGKKILDVGSGAENLAKSLEMKGIDAEVVSLDPLFASGVAAERSKKKYNMATKIIELRRAAPESGRKTVAGMAQALPFKDDTFDLIISHKAMPAYALTKEGIDQFLSEVLRVLKSGGEVRFFPKNRVVTLQDCGHWHDDESLKDHLKDELDKLRSDKDIEVDDSADHYMLLRKKPNTKT